MTSLFTGMTQRGLLDLSRRSHSHRAGSADTDRSQTVEAAIQQRDSELRAYFDTEVLKHVLNPDHQKRSLALTREICALKLAHRQLVASQAAAKKCANATSLQNAVIKQQLQVCHQTCHGRCSCPPGQTSAEGHHLMPLA